MNQRGITLIEMLVVVGILAAAAALTLPAVNSGVDSLRLKAASDGIVSTLNAAVTRADRRHELVEIAVSREQRAIVIRGQDAAEVRRFALPEGVSVTNTYPEPLREEETERSFVLYPGGSYPRIGVEIENRRGARRLVSVDPITGVPRVSEPERQ